MGIAQQSFVLHSLLPCGCTASHFVQTNLGLTIFGFVPVAEKGPMR